MKGVAKLDTVLGVSSKIPKTGLVEMAFWGRSNVGKSSLINGVLNRKSLARTSSQPGKTRTVNYYLVDEKMYLVDLPGYGYAKALRTESEKWMKMIQRYLTESETLRVVFLLVDYRHPPMKNDIEQYDLLCSLGFSPVIIATKSDKVKRSERARNLKEIRQGLNLIPDTPVIPFSAKTGEGKEEIIEYMEAFYQMFVTDIESMAKDAESFSTDVESRGDKDE